MKLLHRDDSVLDASSLVKAAPQDPVQEDPVTNPRSLAGGNPAKEK